jgi:hypothetical protein
MQRVTRACACVLAAVALVAVAVASAEGGSAAAPRLQLVKRSPLQVRGVRFAAGERVRVTAKSITTTRSKARVVQTTSRGSFSAQLGRWGRCATILVTAVGARGDRARMMVRPPSPSKTDVVCPGI